MRIVVWYYGLSTMSTLNQVYLANDGKNRYINLFCIAGLITDVILNFILIPVMGINGAAISVDSKVAGTAIERRNTINRSADSVV